MMALSDSSDSERSYDPTRSVGTVVFSNTDPFSNASVTKEACPIEG